MDVHALVRRELPPPARMLEVGCGSGRLALALADDGYDLVAVDPKAPEGAIFRQTTIEELDGEGVFDAAVAVLSLHHVHDLDVVMRKVSSLLRRDAPFVVREFAWDLVDEPTAAWDYARRGETGGLGDWRAEHEDLHGFEPLKRALDRCFRERSFEWTPYLAEYKGSAEHEAEERRLIEAGEIRAVGFVYVGLA
jgi:SAM-dependent methyltransferase